MCILRTLTFPSQFKDEKSKLNKNATFRDTLKRQNSYQKKKKVFILCVIII